MTAFYNEIDPFAAQWLRNLIDAGHIAPGVVDTRSIEDIAPDELRDYTQVHFFAGIGVWSYALRLAGWPDNRPIWTGSCPCQPFSQAGKGAGVDDQRHLWPHFHWLIQQCKPETVVGEQVASKDGLAWLDTVQSDLEGTGYASAALDLCAAGVGAPHIRQRLFWMAHADIPSRKLGDSGGCTAGAGETACRGMPITSGSGASFGMGDCAGERCEGQRLQHVERSENPEATGASEAVRLGDANSIGRQHVSSESRSDGKGVEQRERLTLKPGYSVGDVGGLEHPSGDGRQGWLFGRQDSGREALDRQAGCNSTANTALQVNGFWRDADWLYCRDGVWRPVEPGTFPLANGSTARVGRLRAYGNAIVAPLAQAFLTAVREIYPDSVAIPATE